MSRVNSSKPEVESEKFLVKCKSVKCEKTVRGSEFVVLQSLAKYFPKFSLRNNNSTQ